MFNNIKLFTVLLSSFYIFGLCAAFFSLQNVLSVVFFLILSGFSIFLKFDYKKAVILYLIFIFGILRVQNLKAPDPILSETEAFEAKLTGNIVSSKDISKEKERIRFYLKVNEAKLDEKTLSDLDLKVLVYLNYQGKINKEITIGDKIEIKGKLRTPKTATNPYQFDYKKYLWNNDCIDILYADISDFEKISSPEFSFNFKDFETKQYFVLQKFELIRNKIIKKHSKYIKSPKLEILGGIVFGNETINPDEKIKESFKNSGLLHLLAASGLNVALIFGIWWWLMSLIKFPYNLTILSGALFTILYTFMTGFPPSILRAAIMLLFVLFGKIIDRTADSVSLVFFAAFLILLFEPKMLFDIGFQLSFVVTLGLIVMCPVINEKFKAIDKNYKEKFKNENEFKKQILYLFSPNNLVAMVSVPLVAQIWVIPLQMHYFNNITPLSVLANIAVVPFIGLLSFLGFVGSIFALIPAFDNSLVYIFDLIANPLLSLLIKISNFFSAFKYSLINTISLNIFQMFSFWAIFLLLTLNIKNDFKNKKQITLTLIAISIFLLSFIQFSSKNLEIIMFDVENADCFLIKTPKNKHIMIDTGKKSYRAMSSYETTFKKYLLNKRIKKLDILIITHFDLDHAGSVIDILKNHKAEKIIIQKEGEDTITQKEIVEYLKNNKFNYEIAKNNNVIYSEPELEIKTLVPIFNNNTTSDNETSIVELLTYKGKTALFLADTSTVGYGKIEKYLPNKIDILKIGHHGAQGVITNSMIKRLNPEYALISAGSNRYNHPASSTLEILRKNNVKIILTKVSGFSKLTIDETSKIKPYHYSKNKKLEPFIFSNKADMPTEIKKYIENFVKYNL